MALIAVVDERLLLLFRRHVKFETPNLIPTALKLAGAYAMLSTAIHTMLDVGVGCSRGGRQRLFPTPGGILRTNLESSRTSTPILARSRVSISRPGPAANLPKHRSTIKFRTSRRVFVRQTNRRCLKLVLHLECGRPIIRP